MAHFAKLDNDNKVVRVYKIGNDVAATEQDGINECVKLHGAGTYKQCSYNTYGGVHWDYSNLDQGEPSADQSKSFRKNYPALGYIYDAAIDGFRSEQPYPSWTLNTTKGLWEPPIPEPDQTDPPTIWIWDENSQSWTS